MKRSFLCINKGAIFSVLARMSTNRFLQGMDEILISSKLGDFIDKLRCHMK
ncbi:MAG: hypothetical protein Q4G58_16815 [bacterium]|nr:hypothetical protein [bacterium]